MRADLIQRRERARDRHEAVLGPDPDRRDPRVQRELAAVLSEYETIESEAELDSNSDPSELAQVVRYIADLHFDLGGGQDVDPLTRALRLHNRALALVGDRNPVRRAKIIFNRAKVLRGLASGGDRSFLEQSLGGFRESRALFQKHEPSLVSHANGAVTMVEKQLALLDQLSSAQAEIEKLDAEIAAAQTPQPAPDDSDTDEGANPQLVMLLLVKSRYDQEIAAGKIHPDRRRILDDVFAELQELAGARGDAPIETLLQRNARLKELMGRVMELLRNPSDGIEVPRGTRRDRVARHIDRARTYVTEEMTRPHKAEWESRRGLELYTEVAKVHAETRRTPDDDTLATFERDVARRVAFAVREHARRRHLNLVAPIWAASPVTARTDAVFYSGGRTQLARVRAACEERGLVVLASAEDGVEPGESRWRQLRSANIAVFDLTVPPEEQATVCYELGIARTLGTDVLVLAEEGATLPFDVEVDPVTTAEDLGDAIDRALYEPVAVESGDSVATFVADVKRALADAMPPPEARYVLGQLEEHAGDPSRVIMLFGQLVGLTRVHGRAMVRSAWAPKPKELAKRRCFHVMPFRPDWSGKARDLVREACGPLATYVRGDEAGGTRIIHSIWDELCAATHVVTDLTDLNRNVLLELGIAHALGRPTLLVSQVAKGDVAKHVIPALAKLRVVTYRIDDASLPKAVTTFLTAKES